VKQIVDLFVMMGCIYTKIDETIESNDGEFYGLGYILNPENNAHVPVVDLRDGDSISEIEVESWERRLGIHIPKPPQMD